MCMICHNLRKRSWTLDECVEALLFHWDELAVEHRESLWFWLYDLCIDDYRYDLIRKML